LCVSAKILITYCEIDVRGHLLDWHTLFLLYLRNAAFFDNLRCISVRIYLLVKSWKYWFRCKLRPS